jgi:peptidoglycan hydrolase-like protein with peptidoglycan-binding domain
MVTSYPVGVPELVMPSTSAARRHEVAIVAFAPPHRMVTEESFMSALRRTTFATAALAVAIVIGGVALAGCSSGSSTPSTTTAASTTTTTSGAAAALKTKALQTSLAAVGCYTGKIDGIAGKGTTAAITAFQKAVGLKADGLDGPNTEGQLAAAIKAHRKVCGTSPTTTTVPSTTTTAAGAMAACTKPAIQAALPAGQTVVDVQCARGWAAGAMTNSQYDSAYLLRSSNGVWVQPPADACTNASYNIPNVILNVSPCKVQ